jgi:sugar/nucleoside kinase (ribokinase family)
VRDIVGRLTDDLHTEPDRPFSTQNLDDIVIGFGGKGANAAFHCARNGGKPIFVGTVGSDFEQCGYRQHLQSHGVNVDHVFRLEGRTSVFLALNSPAGKTHIFHQPYQYTPEENKRFLDHVKVVIQQQLADMVFVTLGNTALAIEILDYARSAGLKTAWNPQFYLPDQHQPIQHLNHTDILFVNEAEAATLESHLRHSIVEFHEVYGVEVVCVTMGERGCRLVDHGQTQVIPGRAVSEVVDPTGAGDAFAGAFLAHAVSPDFSSYARCAELANQAAASLVARLGTQVLATD